jgi:chitin disaccharide deacetylase
VSSVLVITADDYGYATSYDRGILEAARAGAVDAVSVMVDREGLDPQPLIATGVELGLHYELELAVGNAGTVQPGEAVDELRRQLSSLERSFGRPPAYLDSHHHVHAAPELATAIAGGAAEIGLPVRSVDAWHHQLLRRLRVPTPTRLIGRVDESEPVRPPELDALPDGITEWMVHPGYADPAAGSSYDAGREEDLRLLLELGDRDAWRARGIERRTHVEALAISPAGGGRR